MIISNNKKIIVVLNPKTGTQSINTTFNNLDKNNFDYITGHHENLEFFNLQRKIKNFPTLVYPLEDYKIYCFYRNPIDRFISGANYLRRTHIGFFKNFFYDRLKNVNVHSNTIINGREKYNILSQQDKNLIESISYIDILNLYEFLSKKYNLTQQDNKKMLAFFPQVNWIKSNLYQDNIILCDFRNFEQELSKIITAFGHDPTTVEIAKINETIKYPFDNIVDNTTKVKIEEIYKEDYDFFASRGITF